MKKTIKSRLRYLKVDVGWEKDKPQRGNHAVGEQVGSRLR